MTGQGARAIDLTVDHRAHALPIVEAFDLVEDIESCLCSGFVPPRVHAYDLELLSEALYRCIVPAVALATHGLDHAQILDQRAVLSVGALAAAIGEHDQARRRFALPARGLERMTGQICLDVIANRPADDAVLAKSMMAARYSQPSVVVM